LPRLTPEEKQRRKEERRLKKWIETHKNIDGVDHKICTKCNTYYQSTTEFFYHNKSNSLDGLHPYCKRCCLEESLEWREENRDAYLESCKRRNNKPAARIRIRKANKERRENGGYKNWQDKNKDKLRDYNSNRKEKNHKISKKEWEECKSYFDNSCAYCGLTYEEHKQKYEEDLHKEHVDHEGANDLSNCIPSCRPCNSKKHTFSLDDWYNSSNEYYNESKLNKINNWLQVDYLASFQPKKERKPYTKKSK
jgi:hypothetical protein